MSHWIIYSPLSKHAFWNQATDQLNRTNQTVAGAANGEEFFVSINETYPGEGKKGVRLLHWSKADVMFNLKIDEESQSLTMLKPLNFHNPGNEFQRSIDTENIKKWLEEYNWVGFGYIITPDPVDRYTAVNKSVYYTRNNDYDLVVLDKDMIFKEEKDQAIQHWFLVTKAAEDLYVIFCHPDCVIPIQEIDYHKDKHDNLYISFLEESFDYYDLMLRPMIINAEEIDHTLIGGGSTIDFKWSFNSRFFREQALNASPIKPTEIITTLNYQADDFGMTVENKRGIVTLRYKVRDLIEPNMNAKKIGMIERKYLILGE